MYIKQMTYLWPKQRVWCRLGHFLSSWACIGLCWLLWAFVNLRWPLLAIVGCCGPSWAFVGVIRAKGVVGVVQLADVVTNQGGDLCTATRSSLREMVNSQILNRYSNKKIVLLHLKTVHTIVSVLQTRFRNFPKSLN
jgi:hypothetical protein